MPQVYAGFTLNDGNTTSDWSVQELANFKQIIDLLGLGPDYPGTTGNVRNYNLCLGNSGAGVPVRCGIGMAAAQTPASPLHIYGGASGGTPNANALLTLEDDTAPVMQFLSPVNNFQYIWFGDNGSPTAGGIAFYHAAVDRLYFTFAETIYMTLTTTGLGIGGGANPPAYRLHVEDDGARAYFYQSGAAGAVEPLYLRQDDQDVQLIHFRGYKIDGGITGTFVDTDDVAGSTLEGFIKVYITDDSAGDPIADGAYFLPFYSLT